MAKVIDSVGIEIEIIPATFMVRNANRFDDKMGEWIPAWNAHLFAENGATMSCRHEHPTLHRARQCGKRSIGKRVAREF